ncbi:MAG: hypothetical protein ACK5V3_12355 [Bdellovibrionales bacterium]
MNHFDVVLVSSFGQLEALAVEFGRKGLNTLLIDATEKLGSWPLEDREGPFGHWPQEPSSGAWLEVESLGDLVQTLDTGFVFWIKKKGPVALRGPLSAYHKNQLNWLSSTELHKRSFSPESFKRGWLAWLSHSLLGTRFREWSPQILNQPHQDLEAVFGVNNPTRSGLMARREWVRSQNVQVWTDTDILDAVKSQMDVVTGLEVRGPVSGVIKTQSLVWGLTSLETDFLSFRVRDKLFGFEVNKPEWSWIRYRLQIEPVEMIQSWPPYLVLIEHENLPLTHTDMIALQRTVLKNQWDAWIKIPDSKRFHQAYLNRMKLELVEKVKARISGLDVQVVFEPQEMIYTSKEIGPRPVCQYPEGFKKRNYRSKSLYFDGPEIWKEFTASEAKHNQKLIYEDVLAQWRSLKNENQVMGEQ